MKLIRSVVILSLIMNVSGKSSYAQTPQTPSKPVTCNQVIKACDKALQDKNSAIKLRDLAINELKENNTQLTVDVKDKEDKLQSPLRNPFIMTGVGLILGILASKVIK